MLIGTVESPDLQLSRHTTHHTITTPSQITIILTFPSFKHSIFILGLSFWESDACLEQTTRNCFRRYFKDSKKTDILVFTLGMAYGGDKDKEPRTFDMGSWAKHSAVNFRRHIGTSDSESKSKSTSESKSKIEGYTALC